MTANKDLKTRIRALKKATGSNYQTARRQLRAQVRFRLVVDEVIERAKHWRLEQMGHEEQESVFQTLLNKLEGKTTPSPASQELAAYLQSLTDADLHAIGTLMYVGRDFPSLGIPETEEEIEQYHQSLQWHLEARQHVIQQLTEKLPLAQYLISGLRVVRAAGFDIEMLPARAAEELSITCTRCGAPMKLREQPEGQPYKPWTVVSVTSTESNTGDTEEYVRHFCGDCGVILHTKEQRIEFVRAQFEGKHPRISAADA